MYTFSGFSEQVDLMEIELVYGSLETFLTEAAHNVINKEKFDKAYQTAAKNSANVTEGATKAISDHLGNYGRSLDDEHELTHLHDDKVLHQERDEHLVHLKNLYNTNPSGYKKEVSAAKERLPGVTPYGQNAKTSTMSKENAEGGHEKIDGKDVVISVSNKGVAGSVAKIGKGGAVKMQSTCVNSKQSCRGEGAYNVGATCLGKVGCAAWTSNRISNTTLENLKTLKAPATNGAGHEYTHTDEKGNVSTKKVAASPHLDYATLEYDSLTKAAEKAHKLSGPNDTKLVSFRQNTQNETPSLHHDQLLHHLPDHLKQHVATNNYSASVAKPAYDPKNPSLASTHDGILNNTNFSVKGPEVAHNDRGEVVSKNPSSNLKDTTKALNPEVNSKGEVVRVPQNAYVVAGGHSGAASNADGSKTTGVRLRYPKGEAKKTFNISNAPKEYEPFEKIGKIKTARIHTEISSDGAGPDYDHPDGHGQVTHVDPTGKKRTFAYQDYHTHVNSPSPDSHGVVDFHRLNDNVGSDERKPKGAQIRKNKDGHVVGSIHISATTSATPNINADGTHKTDASGKMVGDKNGLASDPFTFPIQNHIDKDNPTRINLNHPTQLFAAEAAERKKKSVAVSLPTYQEHPKTKAELGEI